MSEKLIYDILKGKDTLNPALKRNVKQSFNLDKSLASVSNRIAIARNAIGAFAAASGIARIVEEAVELENALVGLGSVAFNTSNDVNATKKAAIELASDGIIPLSQAANSLKNLLASGLSLPKSIKLLDAFRNAAAFNRQGQLQLGEAVQRATEGFKNRLSINVDNVGITKNLSQIEREYTKETGRSTHALDEKSRSQILANGLIREGSLFQGDYNKLQDTFSGQLSKIQGNYKFLLADLGEFITKNGDAIDAVGRFGTALENLRVIINDLKEETSDNNESLSTSVIKFLAMGGAVGFLAKKIAELNLQGIETILESGAQSLPDQIKEGNKELDGLIARQVFLEELGKKATARQVLDRNLLKRNIKIKQAALDILKAENDLIREKSRLESGASKSGAPEDESVDKEAEKRIALLARINQQEKDLIIQNKEEIRDIDAEFALLKDSDEVGRAESRLERISAQIQAEKELDALAALEKNVAKADSEEKLLNLEKKFNAAKTKNRQDELKKELVDAKKAQDLQREIDRKKLEDKRAFFSAATSLASSENKSLAAIGKAFAITQIAIDTPRAIASSFRFGSSIGGPAVGFTLGAIAATAMAAQAAKVAGVKGFQTGGIVDGPSTGDKNLIGTNGREMVLTREQQSNLFEIANGRGPEGQGQDVVSGDIVIQIDGREIFRAVKDQISEGRRLTA